MPITHTEKLGSGASSEGRDNRTDLVYTIKGTTDETAARTYLRTVAAPATYDGKIAQDYRVEPEGDGSIWTGTATYVALEQQVFQPPQTGETTFQFDTSGATQHITVSRATVGRIVPLGGWKADYGNLIGVDSDGVAQGVDIGTRAFDFNVTYYVDKVNMTAAYIRSLYLLTQTVNNASFTVTVDGVPLTFEAGELLFKGATGSKRGGGDWEITGKFSASPNVTNTTIGDITGINKKGWEYLWVEYVRVEQTGAFTPKRLVSKPIQVNIEQVYEYKDFTVLAN